MRVDCYQNSIEIVPENVQDHVYLQSFGQTLQVEREDSSGLRRHIKITRENSDQKPKEGNADENEKKCWNVQTNIPNKEKESTRVRWY